MADQRVGSSWGRRGRRGALASAALSTLVLMGSMAAASIGVSPAGAATGGSWVATNIPSVASFEGVSCLSVSNCFAVGDSESQSAGATGVIYTTGNGGGTWTPEAVSTTDAGLKAVSCVPSTSVCVAVGNQGSDQSLIVRTTNAGNSWSPQAAPAGDFALVAVSCPSTSECIAVMGNNSANGPVLVTTNSGTTWTAGSVPAGTFGLADVSCMSVSDCVAVGYDAAGHAVITTTDGGAVWEAVPGAPAELGAVSCVVSTAFCVAGGGTTTAPAQIFTSSNGGSSWTQRTPPSGLPAILDMSCPSTSDCSSVGSFSGGSVAGTSDGGVSWATESVPAGTGNLSGISCPSILKCYAVGKESNGTGLILSSASSLTITTSSLPPATIGSSYSQSLSAESGNPPYTWKVASGKLPKGLRLDRSTGLISGIPAKKATNSTFTVEVLDTKTGKPKTQNTATATFTITVS
jgi:photosystem II stability/assembly factor-like uncharacterized protein